MAAIGFGWLPSISLIRPSRGSSQRQIICGLAQLGDTSCSRIVRAASTGWHSQFAATRALIPSHRDGAPAIAQTRAWRSSAGKTCFEPPDGAGGVGPVAVMVRAARPMAVTSSRMGFRQQPGSDDNGDGLTAEPQGTHQAAL